MSREVTKFRSSIERQRLYMNAIEGNDPGPYPDTYRGVPCRVDHENAVGQYYVVFEKADTPRYVSKTEVVLGKLDK